MISFDTLDNSIAADRQKQANRLLFDRKSADELANFYYKYKIPIQLDPGHASNYPRWAVLGARIADGYTICMSGRQCRRVACVETTQEAYPLLHREDFMVKVYMLCMRTEKAMERKAKTSTRLHMNNNMPLIFNLLCTTVLPDAVA